MLPLIELKACAYAWLMPNIKFDLNFFEGALTHPSKAAYMCQWTASALVQVVAYRLAYCELHS